MTTFVLYLHKDIHTREEVSMNVSQAQGTILGLAIGDALGHPTEFRTREKILASFGPAGVTDFVGIHDSRWPRIPLILGSTHPPGTYTDDTQMSIAVARGLLETHGRDGHDSLDDKMRAIARHFVTWANSSENNRAPGETCMTGCRNLEKGMPWREAGVARSKGCGSVMRVAPIGVLYHNDRAMLLEVARASSILTHGHDAAVEASAAGALMVAMAADGSEPEEIYDAMMALCAPRSADLSACLEKVPKMLDAPPEIALSEQGLGESWVGDEAIASALYCFWRHKDDYVAGVLEAINTDGDSDSIGCIAGSALGARLGLDAIPKKWRDEVEDSAMLHELARELYAAST